MELDLNFIVDVKDLIFLVKKAHSQQNGQSKSIILGIQKGDQGMGGIWN